jgi:hypothetical protein
MSDKSTNKVKRPGKGSVKKTSWIDDLLMSSKTVGVAAKKIDFYRQARRDAPEALTAELKELEAKLDASVKLLLDERESLKADVLGDPRFDSDALREIEFSYQKAVCFTSGKERARSRMFFLPCVYWSKDDGTTGSVIDFGGVKAQTFSEFISAFLDEHFGDKQLQMAKVSLYPESLMDWNVKDEEEKMLPMLHRSILDGKAMDLDESFPARAKAITDSEGPGWSVAVLPFAVEHDDEAWLESISFDGFEEAFVESFEGIFDPSSRLDYDCPCDPTMIQDQAVRLLWMKQVELIVAEISSTKKTRQIGVVEVTFHWEDGEPVGVVMDFKIVEPDASSHGDDDDDGVVYHRQVSRQTLVDETPGQLASFLAEYPPLLREDFDVVMGHQFENGSK